MLFLGCIIVFLFNNETLMLPSFKICCQTTFGHSVCFIYVTFSVKSRLKSKNLILRSRASNFDYKHQFHYDFNL